MSDISVSASPRFSYNGLTAGENEPLLFIAGPCVIEGEERTLAIAKRLKEIASTRKIQLVFKASFDKANRTSASSFRGYGMKEGLRILAMIKKETGLPLLTDIHTPDQAEPVAEVVDILQIPAFLCRQTDMLLAAVETGRAVNVKKGQFISGDDAEFIVKKCETALAEKRLLLCERGNAFGYHNLVVDMRNLQIMRAMAPVVYDGTHSVQLPSASGGVSGGGREFIPGLLRAATAMGIDGVFMETHPEPENALSDAATMFPLNDLPELIDRILKIRDVSGG